MSSSLACKFVFYRPEHNANGGPDVIKIESSWNAKMKYPNG